MRGIHLQERGADTIERGPVAVVNWEPPSREAFWLEN
jgi:hypothetical protein